MILIDGIQRQTGNSKSFEIKIRKALKNTMFKNAGKRAEIQLFDYSVELTGGWASSYMETLTILINGKTFNIINYIDSITFDEFKSLDYGCYPYKEWVKGSCISLIERLGEYYDNYEIRDYIKQVN